MKKFTSKILLVLVVASIFVLAITSKVSSTPTHLADAKAQIIGSDLTGELSLKQGPNGIVMVHLALRGDPATLTPGLHGVHIHEKSICQADVQPRFSTAGGHFDPGPYGNSTPVEENHPYHLGDLPNIEINDDGEGRLVTVTSRVTLYKSPVSIFDRNGSAIIVHQLPDQMIAGGTAAESGGARIACGVIKQT